MNDVTLRIVVERLLDPYDADELMALIEEKDGTIESERSAYEIEQDIDQHLSKYIDTSDIHDIVDFEVF
jgi:hypothetical protein